MNIESIPITKKEWQSIFSASVLAVLGYILSIFLCDSELFARFGSVIVCVGIIFSLDGFSNSIDLMGEVADERMERVRSELYENIEFYPIGQELKNMIKEKTETDVNEAVINVRKIISKTKMRLLKVEATIVIIGTLIWGFGDYLVIPIKNIC